MKISKKLISILLTMCIMIGVAVPAFADPETSSPVEEPFIDEDGFSYAYSKTDPSGYGSYGAFSYSSRGNVIFERALAALLVSQIASGLIGLLPLTGVAAEAAQLIGSAAAGSISFGNSNHVYYKLYIARHNQLPGFYQHLKYVWYETSSYNDDEIIGTTYIYRFKA
ncbi:MAG: hypothetical protein ACI3VE_01050 [Oscillospiraceae bacterium]